MQKFGDRLVISSGFAKAFKEAKYHTNCLICPTLFRHFCSLQPYLANKLLQYLNRQGLQ